MSTVLPRVSERQGSGPLPPAFAEAVEGLRRTPVRPDVTVEEVAPPRTLAPHAVAFTARVPEPAYGHGRLVVLHDPARLPEWGGPTRVVLHVAAEVEAELGADPMLADVAWSWLLESLERHDAEVAELGGTVTRQASTRFGRLAEEDDERDSGEVELRASWTPVPDDALAVHLAAWVDVLADAVGLPPPGVATLPSGDRAHR